MVELDEEIEPKFKKQKVEVKNTEVFNSLFHKESDATKPSDTDNFLSRCAKMGLR